MALDRPWRHSVAIVFAPALIYRRLDRDGRSEPKTNTLRTRVCPGNLLPFFFLFFFVFFFNGARPTTVRRDRLTRPDRFHQRPVSIRTDDVVINMETKKKSRSCPAKNRRKILSDSLLVSGWVPLVIYEFSINCCDTRKDGNALPYSSIVKLGKSQ